MTQANKEIRLAIIFLFLINLFVGLFFINAGLFHYDSVVLAQAVENTYKTGILHPGVRGRFGAVILNLIVYFPFFILGQNADFAVRFSGVIFHCLSVVALFLFVQEIFKDRIQAFFAALLLSFTPFYFQPNTYGKEHGASMFFLLLSFYYLAKGLNNSSFISLGIASLLLGIAVTVKESTLTIVPFFFWFYFQPRISIKPFKVILGNERIKLKSVAALVFPFLVFFTIIWLLYLKNQIITMNTVNEPGRSYFIGFSHSVFVLAFRDLFFSLPFLVFLFGLGGLFKIIKEKKYFLSFFLFSWFLLIFYFGNLGSYCARYLDIIVIPLYLSAAYFLSYLYKKNIWVILIVAYLVLDMFFCMYPLLEYRRIHNGGKQLALYVRNNTEDNAIIISGDDGPFINYYAKRKVISWPAYDNKQRIIDFTNSLKCFLKKEIPVYIVEPPLEETFFKYFSTTILDNFNLKNIGQVRVEDYHRPELLIIIWRIRLFKLGLKNTEI